jgi:hypothetical protein
MNASQGDKNPGPIQVCKATPIPKAQIQKLIDFGLVGGREPFYPDQVAPLSFSAQTADTVF